MSGWIACGERMPREHSEVLAIWDICGVQTCVVVYYTDHDTDQMQFWEPLDMTPFPAGEITHWMPLPAPPASGNAQD